jgi:CubicO group peptidase (beta-lactamase class C family)
MVDTGFAVPPGAIDRLTTFFAPDPVTDALSTIDAPANSWWSREPSFPDASGGLVSTIDDYWRFASMMIGGGTVGGTRVLAESTVTLMTTDRLTAAQRVGTDVFLAPHAGWGLGMEVPAAGRESEPFPCGFGWDGGSGTSWRTNRVHDATGILLTQRAMTSPEPPAVFYDFWSGVNAALDA